MMTGSVNRIDYTEGTSLTACLLICGTAAKPIGRGSISICARCIKIRARRSSRANPEERRYRLFILLNQPFSFYSDVIVTVAMP